MVPRGALFGDGGAGVRRGAGWPDRTERLMREADSENFCVSENEAVYNQRRK